MTCGSKIRMMRINHSMTQAELAKVLGVERRKISDWEQEKKTAIGSDIIQRMSDYFHVSPDYFVDDLDTNYIVEQLEKMIAHEESADCPHYGARLYHWYGDTQCLTIDAGGLRALIDYYTTHMSDENMSDGKGTNEAKSCSNCGHSCFPPIGMKLHYSAGGPMLVCCKPTEKRRKGVLLVSQEYSCRDWRKKEDDETDMTIFEQQGESCHEKA